MLQSVLNCLKNVNPLIRTYVLSLMLTSGKKNCAEMARSTRVSPDTLYEFLSHAKICSKEIEKMLLDYADQTRAEGVLRALTVDPTTLIKRYAYIMDNLCYDMAGCTKHVERCLVPVYISITDKNVKIPLDLDFWVQEKITGKRKYKSKVKITQKLILSCRNKGVKFDFVPLDGAYSAGPNMFKFFKEEMLKFTMRIARTRCIELPDGTRVQLKHCPTLKLMKNTREKTIQAKLYGETYFFTAQKRRKSRGGWETVFLVSNMDLPAKEQVAAFNQRWPQEKINRTTKQKFGSNQCQVLESQKQRAHILAGFLAHTILEIKKNDNQANNVDEMVNILRGDHFNDLMQSNVKSHTSQNKSNVDQDLKTFQSCPQATSKNVNQYSSFWT